jgi:hypothetical protein
VRSSCIWVCCLLTIYLKAQQNFINVPTGEGTKGGNIFFQQQVNINELIQSNTSLEFGIGKNAEIGLNVLGLNWSEKQRSFFHNDSNDVDPYNPLAAMNMLKQFKLNKCMSISAGAQFGFNYRNERKTHEAALVYTNFNLKDPFSHCSNIVGGIYYNSMHYGGSGNRTGLWMGTEFMIIPKLHVTAETILGNNSLCNSSFGLVLYPKKYLPITVGIQLPNTQKNSASLVFELTYIP